MDIWNSLADVERAAEVTPYLVVAFGALVSVSGIFLKGRVDKRSGAWNATPVLVRAARVTPYAIVWVGALVSASGVQVKGVFDRRIAVLAAEAIQELKNTPPDVRVRLGTATNNGQANPGRTLLEITAKNDIEYNAKWHVSLASPISRRFRMQQYLGNRLAVDPELARSFPSAQTLTMTRQSHSSIKIHSVHPPPSIRSILTKAIDGPILVRRRNRTIRPLHWGIIAPPFSFYGRQSGRWRHEVLVFLPHMR